MFWTKFSKLGGAMLAVQRVNLYCPITRTYRIR